MSNKIPANLISLCSSYSKRRQTHPIILKNHRSIIIFQNNQRFYKDDTYKHLYTTPQVWNVNKSLLISLIVPTNHRPLQRIWDGNYLFMYGKVIYIHEEMTSFMVPHVLLLTLWDTCLCICSTDQFTSHCWYQQLWYLLYQLNISNGVHPLKRILDSILSV